MKNKAKSLLPAIGLVLFSHCGDSQDVKSVITDLNTAEFKKHIEKDKGILLDVRTPEEYAEGHLAGSVNINYLAGDFDTQIGKLEREKIYFVYCRSGRRSAGAAEKMQDAGFKKVYNLTGGILAWQKDGLPVTEK